MINHARTLLLNIAAQRTQLQDLGYEYMPTAFKPIALPPALRTVRRALFGSRPDNYFLNVRARELLGYIHETELRQYAYALDPRVTYWPPRENFFENAKARVNIIQTFGQPLRLNFGGSFTANNATGTAVQSYDVELIKNIDETFNIATTQLTKETLAQPEITVLRSTTQTTAVPLAETQLRFAVNFAAAADITPDNNLLLTELAELLITERFDADALPVGIALESDTATLSMQAAPPRMRVAASELEAGTVAKWRIDAVVNPPPAITSVPALELLGEPLFLELFGVSDTEPYATFKNLWFDHPLPAYRLGGLVLALIYRSAELYGKNG